MSIPRRQVIEWNKFEDSSPPRSTLCLLLDRQDHYWVGFWDGDRFAIQSDISTPPDLVEWAELSDPAEDQEANDALAAIIDGNVGPEPGSDTIVSAVKSLGLGRAVIRRLDQMVVWAHDEGETFESMCEMRRLRAGTRRWRVAWELWKMRYGVAEE